MEKSYRIAKKTDTREIDDNLVRNGDYLLPLVGLIEVSEIAVREMVDMMDRANDRSGVAFLWIKGGRGKEQGKDDELIWHCLQPGSVYLGEHKVRVNQPRLHR